QLSGGQQQRVAIARALAMDPIILLLDEPTSALDPDLRDEVLNTLRKIAEEGIAMIIVTHEVDFAIDVADKIVFMDNGKIIEEGKPREIIYKTKSDMIKRYLKSIHMR
ncbi:MAG: ATP-binding cassette domain-containing protein, partial [Candidatus Desulfofervidus auxilii]|nr:ATP-binding cassette domain-containing protein [Candidatus Desulfofervidus auxilii]